MQTQASAGRTDEADASISVPLVLRNLQKCKACGFPVSQGRTFCVECEEKKWRGQRLPQAAAAAASTVKAAAAPKQAAASSVQTSLPSPARTAHQPSDSASFGNSAMFSSSAAPSRSWFAANKYVLGALLVVAIVVAVIAWFR
jgi:uncharacterized Zn finger protein (UPF0148 family)